MGYGVMVRFARKGRVNLPTYNDNIEQACVLMSPVAESAQHSIDMVPDEFYTCVGCHEKFSPGVPPWQPMQYLSSTGCTLRLTLDPRSRPYHGLMVAGLEHAALVDLRAAVGSASRDSRRRSRTHRA